MCVCVVEPDRQAWLKVSLCQVTQKPTEQRGQTDATSKNKPLQNKDNFLAGSNDPHLNFASILTMQQGSAFGSFALTVWRLLMCSQVFLQVLSLPPTVHSKAYFRVVCVV